MSQSTRKDLVMVGEFPPKQRAIIDQEYIIHSFEEVMADQAVLERIHGVITKSNFKVSRQVVESIPNLKIVATCGVGFDGIPLDAAWARGVVVTHTPGVLDAAVCELAIGILLGLLRKIPAADRYLREGRWGSAEFPLTASLSGKTVGILGMGRIGQALSARLAPFGVRIAYTGSVKPQLAYRHVASLGELARESDILFVSCRGGEETRHLVNAAILEALGPQGYLVNIARGSVVDEKALIEALSKGIIKGAGLDVYASEPNVDPALAALPNTVLTPHLGSATEETRAAMLDLTLENLRAVLGGKPAVTPVPRQ